MSWTKRLYSNRYKIALPVGIVLLILILINSVIFPLVMNSHEVVYHNVTIIEKVMRSNNVPFAPAHALIYAECEDGTHIFSNEYSLLRGKFAVMETYFELEVGETYDLTVYHNKFQGILLSSLVNNNIDVHNGEIYTISILGGG